MVPKVSVVIPNFNGVDLLSKNLPKVISDTLLFDSDAEIIVVDNGSNDGSAEYLKSNLPEVRIVKLSSNTGFSHAMNIGMRMAKGKFVVSLNNDVITDGNYLEKAYPHFQDKNVFAVSFHERGFGNAKGKFEDGYVGHCSGEETNSSKETFWVSGGSGIFRKEVLTRLGYFDEKLFSPFYWEDVDLGYRALKRGYKLIWEPGAIVIHHHESTAKKISKKLRDFIIERNQLLFIWKNLTSKILFRKHIKGILKRVTRHPGYSRIVIAALLKFRTVRYLRLKEIKETTVSDETVFLKFG